jgi:hypothetical protein
VDRVRLSGCLMNIHIILSHDTQSYLGLKANELKEVSKMPGNVDWYGVWRMDLWPNDLAALPERTDYRPLILVNGQAPAEVDMKRFFKISAPSVHAMVKRLDEFGFITRVRGQGRSISVVVSPEVLPVLRSSEEQ